MYKYIYIYDISPINGSSSIVMFDDTGGHDQVSASPGRPLGHHSTGVLQSSPGSEDVRYTTGNQINEGLSYD